MLAVDIGSGTQDILLYEDGIPVENCVKLVLPSQTRIMAGRLARATRHGQHVFLTGHLMGGGPLVRALKQHLGAGLQAYATPLAAKTVRDDLQEVEAMGVRIVDHPPEGNCYGIYLLDIDLESLQQALELFDIELPQTVAVAVQDHGECIGRSNRKFRFEHWKSFLAGNGRLPDLLYGGREAAFREVPPYLTRMLSVRDTVPGAYVMDTGAAAIRGALLDPAVREHQEQGLLIVNVGNQHTLAALIRGDAVLGIFEHHTGLLTPAKLHDYLQRFARGQVTNEEVYNDRGHGCAYLEAFTASGTRVEAAGARAEAAGVRPPGDHFFVAVTGPLRQMAEGLGYFAAPHGDMMLTGCFGLVESVRDLLEVRGQRFEGKSRPI